MNKIKSILASIFILLVLAVAFLLKVGDVSARRNNPTPTPTATPRPNPTTFPEDCGAYTPVFYNSGTDGRAKVTFDSRSQIDIKGVNGWQVAKFWIDEKGAPVYFIQIYGLKEVTNYKYSTKIDAVKVAVYKQNCPTPKPTTTPTIQPTATPLTTSTPVVTPTSTPTVVPTATPVVTPTPTATSSATLVNMYVTWYGWPDNDPAGTAIAYPKEDGYPTLHNGAGGIGTWDDPVTFAAKIGKFPVGTKLYVPFIKKYVILEDTCASCTGDWIDIWLNSIAGNSNKVIACEEYWTRNADVEINPPSDREVDIVPMYDTATNVCRN